MSAALVAATLAAVAALLAGRPRAVRSPEPRTTAPARPDVPVLRRLRPVISALAAGGAYAFLGGPLGLLAAVAAGWTSWRVLGAAEGPEAVRRRERLARDLPTGVDLLAACVQSGAAVESALVTVADALGGPFADELRDVHHGLALGLDPVAAWQRLDALELRPLSRAVLRAHESGAAVSEAISRLADDLREQARAGVLARASSVEVRAAAPLGACFLPAFVLVGVVPLVAGAFGSLRLF